MVSVREVVELHTVHTVCVTGFIHVQRSSLDIVIFFYVSGGKTWTSISSTPSNEYDAER